MGNTTAVCSSRQCGERSVNPNPPKHCPKCGSRMVAECPDCGQRVADAKSDLPIPTHCEGCGAELRK